LIVFLAQFALGISVTFLGGKMIPTLCFNGVLWYALAGIVHDAHFNLSARITLFCERSQFIHGGREITNFKGS